MKEIRLKQFFQKVTKPQNKLRRQPQKVTKGHKKVTKADKHLRRLGQEVAKALKKSYEAFDYEGNNIKLLIMQLAMASVNLESQNCA